MKYKLLTTSLVLSGSLAIGAGAAFSQSAPESNRSGGNLPGTSQGDHQGAGETQKIQRGMDLSLEEIKQIQQALKEKGHEPGSAKGVMNAETREAIREFQKANKLSVTGTVDEETAQKLGAPRSEYKSGGGASGADFGSGSSGSPL